MLHNDIKEIIKLLKNNHHNTLISYKNCVFYPSDVNIGKLLILASIKEDRPLFDILECLNPGKVFALSNRKYLGSKTNLLSFIGTTVLSITGTSVESFFDPFAGTGVVAHWMRQYADRIIANDLLFSNFLGLRVFLTAQRNKINIDTINRLICHCNELSPFKGYVCSHFGGTYFTPRNAGLIDAIRNEIRELWCAGKCTDEEKDVLLVSLLYSMDKCANTVGQYDAFLKHLGSDVMVKGKHKIDSNVYKPLTLRRPFLFFDDRNEVYQGDANTIAKQVTAEVVYLDPPYNHRQYIDCYHLLENIMLWEKPETFGKTRKFKRNHLKSDYSRVLVAPTAFADLIRSLRCRHIFLSYNSEGIIRDDDIYTILKTRGTVEIFKKEYPIFGHGAGVAKKRPVTERLFYVRVRR